MKHERQETRCNSSNDENINDENINDENIKRDNKRDNKRENDRRPMSLHEVGGIMESLGG
jgi:hypothetical protein